MMKNLCLTAVVLLSSMTCAAQWGPRRMQKEPAENYELKAMKGKATMVIDAANGARIMSLKYDTTEVLNQNPMPNMYGSTFWTSPQKEWNWPPVREHDMGRYTVEEKDGAIVMTSGLSEKIPLRITKTFRKYRDAGFLITYRITNEGKEERRVAPWEVTRVPGKGEISFECHADSIWPAGLMNFRQQGEQAVFSIDKVDKQRKINANSTASAKWVKAFAKKNKDAKTLWPMGVSRLRYVRDNIVLTKYFPDLKAGEAAPGEDEIQVYVHQDALYCELEEQGAYTLLQPGESVEWTVMWTVDESSK